MLSVFPSLFTFELIAPFILRVAVGFIFIYIAISKIKKTPYEKDDRFQYALFVTEAILGGLLVIGLFTQAVASLLSIITIGSICKKVKNPASSKNSLEFFILTLAVLLSLLFIGAGFFAFDLPL